LALAVTLAAVGCSSAPPPEAPTPEAPEAAAATATAAAISAADLELHLTVLAHDSMMGRESGTLGNYMATAYIAAEAERIGLEPAGEDGYFQTIPLVETALAGDATIALEGEALELGTDYLPIPGFGGFLPFGTTGSLDGAQAIYAGLMTDTAASLTLEQVAGKLVVLGPPAGPAQPNPEGWGAYSTAAGVAIVVLDFLPPEVRNMLQQPSTSLGGGEAAEGPLGMAISHDAAARLLGLSLAEVTVGTTGKTLEGTFRFDERPAPYAARNVVGIVRGSDPELRDEYVAIGSHNDHTGVGSTADHDSIWAFNHVVRPEGAESPMRPATDEEQVRITAILDSLRAQRPARPDSIFNGADDNGSGTVAMLEIAEMFATNPEKPQRSILFVWHTAEEKGLFGAGHYTDNPTVPRESIVASLNLDMVGRGSEGDVEGGGPSYIQLIGSRRLSTELGDLVESVNTSTGLNFEFDYTFDADGHPQNYYCRSDHYMYARYGIPIVFFSTGSHQDYHQLTDELQYINFPKMARLSQLVYEIAREVANLDHRVVVDKPVPELGAPCRQ
jgi:hypothetical protein